MEDKYIDYPIQYKNRTPATIRKAFDRAFDKNRPEQLRIEEAGTLGNINISRILSKIIEDVGRFAESYASDCLYEIEDIKYLCEHVYPLDEPIDEILSFGIRQDGVDGNNSIMNQLHNSRRGLYPYVHATPYYRRILAVRVHAYRTTTGHPRLRCELRDITNGFNTFEESDLTPDGKLKPAPYEPNMTSNQVETQKDVSED